MAKRTKRNSTPASVTPITDGTGVYKTLTGKLRTQIDKLRDRMTGVVEATANFLKRRSEIVDDYMALWNVINTERAHANPPLKALNFVEYARLVDPSIPEKRDGDDGYRIHSGYQAALYIQRLSREKDRRAKTGQAAAGTGTDEAGNAVGASGNRVQAFSPAQVVARLLASFLQVFTTPAVVAKMWEQVAAELKLTPEMLANLKGQVAETTPLIDLSGLKGQARTVKVLHMEAPKRTRRTGIAAAAVVGLSHAETEAPPQQRRRA